MDNLIFWAVAGGGTLVVLSVLLRTLSHTSAPSRPGGSPDLKIYRDQLAEVDRDLARGVTGVEEALRLRTEVSRRLLDADRLAQNTPIPAHVLPRTPIIALLVLALLGGVTLYAWLGAPGYPDLPIAERLAMADVAYRNRPSQTQAEAQMPADPTDAPRADPEFLALMEKLRAAIANRPDDSTGLALLARNEATLGNFAAAAKAQSHLVAVLGSKATAEQHAMVAEYLIAAAGGYVSPQAEVELTRTLALDPQNGIARYYSGLMFAQVGRPDRAFALWEPLLREGPAGATWIAPIRAGLSDLAARAGIRYTLPEATGPTADDIAAADAMTATDRQAMIAGMVAALENRLMSQGGPVEDWLKLLNALGILGQPERAKAALAAAEIAFSGDEPVLTKLRQAAMAAGRAP